MTTIAWDGRTLAVDSRSSSPALRVHEEDIAAEKRICLHCERPAWTGTDATMKLIVMPDCMWKTDGCINRQHKENSPLSPMGVKDHHNRSSHRSRHEEELV